MLMGIDVNGYRCNGYDKNTLFCTSARNIQRGEEAKASLESEGLRPLVLELDVDSIESIRAARVTVEEKYGGRVDVLVNNAGVLFRVCPPTSMWPPLNNVAISK